MYADYSIHAEDNEAARILAIEEFKARAHEFQWLDPNYDNLALAFPSPSAGSQS